MAADRAVDVLLIGGGVASVRCARTLRRNGFAGSILLVGDENLAPYNRPPLSKELLRDDLPDELVSAEAPTWYERRSVELAMGVAVTALDPGAGRAALDDGRSVSFERCLLATGAGPRRLPVPGGDRALLLRTLDDSRRLRAAAMRAGPKAPVVVVGGGFIGLEVASWLAAAGLRPTIVEVAAIWGGSLGTELPAWALARLRSAGVTVRVGAAVSRIEPDAAWIGDERLPAAFAVAGIGVRPRDELAVAAGLSVDDGIVVDAAHRTGDPRIWAAGDVARVAGRRVEHWHSAREGGARAALSMLGAEVPPAPVPWLFSEIAGIAIDVIGVATEWDEERWTRDGSVLAYARDGLVVQLAVIGSAIPQDHARALVASCTRVDHLERALTARSL